jgi:HEAT repeat protein
VLIAGVTSGQTAEDKALAELKARAIKLLEVEMRSDGQYSADAAFALLAEEPKEAAWALIHILEQGKGGAQFVDAVADSLAPNLDKAMIRYVHKSLGSLLPPRWAMRLASHSPEKRDLKAFERYFTSDYVDPQMIPLLTAYGKDAVPLLERMLHRSAMESCQAAVVLASMGDTVQYGEEELYGSQNICLAWSLADADHARGRPLMLSYLDSDNPNARRTAAYAMGLIGDSAYVPALRGLLGDSDRVVGQNAAFSLGVFGDTSGAHLLREAALDTSFSGRNTEKLFSHMPGALVAPVIHPLLEKNQGLATARAAAAAASVRDTSSIPYILELLSDTNPSTVAGSIAALAAYGDPSLEKVIRPYLYSDEQRLETSAMAALAQLGDTSIVMTLNLMLFWEPGPYGENLWIRQPIVDALVKIGDTAAFPALAVLLGRGDPYLDIKILNFFAEKGTREYLPYVEPRMDDIFEAVRVKAASAVLEMARR